MTRDENMVLNVGEYSHRLTTLRSLPQFLVVELTQECNLRCSMCNSGGVARVNSRMNPAYFAQICEELFSTANVVDLRGWGESLILPDITHYIERTASAGCRVRFVSNLSFRRPKVIDCLTRHRAMLSCSLDAATPEVLVKLRKGAHWNSITQNLACLARTHPFPEMISVLCTVQAPALATLPQLPGLLDRLNIHQLHFASVASRNPELCLDHNSVFAREQIQRTIEECKRFQVTPTFTTTLPGIRVDPMTCCMRPWTTMHINVNGRIGYCDHLIGPYAKSQLLGHLSEGSLTVWNNEAWQNIRMQHLLKCPQYSKCAKCYSEKGTDLEPIWLGAVKL